MKVMNLLRSLIACKSKITIGLTVLVCCGHSLMANTEQVFLPLGHSEEDVKKSYKLLKMNPTMADKDLTKKYQQSQKDLNSKIIKAKIVEAGRNKAKKFDIASGLAIRKLEQEKRSLDHAYKIIQEMRTFEAM